MIRKLILDSILPIKVFKHASIMDISSSIVLEESLYMTFTVKGNQMYYELDEPEDKDLTITIDYGDTQKTFHQSMVDNCFKQYGTYMFTFHTAKGTKLTVDFQENSLSFTLFRI